jgi:thiol-disulfide isomerase/thioredoxin
MKQMRRAAWAALVLVLLGVTAVRAADTSGTDPAPEFKGIAKWLNGDPLTMRQLRGKVVLIDFWTYSCINCLRTLPYVEKWYETYKDKGLVVVGVHTPEFAFERETKNVQTAIQHFGIKYPVAQDNNYAMWQAYDNHYWPADYVIDQKGNIVANFFGEGDYDKIEDKIRTLISAGPAVAEDNGQDLSKIGSPEMYFGTLRLENLASPEKPTNAAQAYTAPSDLPLNKFALVGNWSVGMEYAALSKDGGEVRLHFKAGKVHMVAGSAQPVTVAVTVDGKPQPSITVQGSQLYTLFDSSDYGEHELELKIPKAGFNAYTFTFG